MSIAIGSATLLLIPSVVTSVGGNGRSPPTSTSARKSSRCWTRSRSTGFSRHRWVLTHFCRHGRSSCCRAHRGSERVHCCYSRAFGSRASSGAFAARQRSEGTSSLTAKNDQLLQLIYLGGQERVTYSWDEGVRRTHAILAIKTLLVDIRDSETLFCIDGLTQSDPKKRRIHRTFWGFSVLVCTSLFSKKRRSNVTLCLLPFWSESDL